MKKYIIATAVIAVLLSGCIMPSAPKDTVLCGTTMVASLVKDCAPDLKTATLIPSEACPGTYDLKPEDAKKITSAKMFIGQPFIKPLGDKLAAMDPGMAVRYVNTPDLQVPENYFRGLQEAASLLAMEDGRRARYYIENMNRSMRAVREAIINDSGYLMKLRSKKIKVLASGYQEAFAKYLGLDVVAVFGSPSKLNPAALQAMAAKARQAGVTLIISNLTGDHDASADALNRLLKVKKAVLISFPGETAGQSLFLNLWGYNLAQIKAAAGQ